MIGKRTTSKFWDTNDTWWREVGWCTAVSVGKMNTIIKGEVAFHGYQGW